VSLAGPSDPERARVSLPAAGETAERHFVAAATAERQARYHSDRHRGQP